MSERFVILEFLAQPGELVEIDPSLPPLRIEEPAMAPPHGFSYVGTNVYRLVLSGDRTSQ